MNRKKILRSYEKKEGWKGKGTEGKEIARKKKEKDTTDGRRTCRRAD